MNNKKASRPRKNAGVAARFIGVAQFVLVVGLAFCAVDTVLVRILRLRPEFYIYPLHVYFGRSFALYAVFVVACALAGALLGFIMTKIRPRRFLGAGASAAGGALFGPVLALAVPLNRSFDLTITHPAILAGDVVVLLLWLVLSLFVGARVFALIGPAAARGWGRVAWGVLGYGCAVLLLVISAFVYVVPELTRPPTAERRMNVLLISIDALRRDRLGCYGYERVGTPNIDRFAASATKFENGCCNAPWTLPSMAAMVTGRYPTVCGVDALNRLRPGVPTLAELLRAEGYRNEAYVTNIFMHPEYGYANGFDVYLMNGDSRALYPFRGTLLYTWADTASRAMDARLGRSRTDTQFNGDETIAALRRLGKGSRPFFIWCHFMDPHNPYTPPRGYVPDYPGIPASEAYELLDELTAKGWDVGDWPIKGNDMDKFSMLYDGEIAYVDEHFGRIIDALDETGLAGTTAVIVLNDHGEEFHDHGSYGHGHTLYPELINMVLLARIPGFEFPIGTSRRSVSHVDIVPTVLDALAVSTPAKLDGRSLLEGGATRQDGSRAFAERLQRGPEKKAVRQGEWLLIFDPASGQRELYDISVDPGAKENIAGRGVPAEEDLCRELEYFIAYTGEEVEKLGGPAPMALSEERRARLRGLGYVGP